MFYVSLQFIHNQISEKLFILVEVTVFIKRRERKGGDNGNILFVTASK